MTEAPTDASPPLPPPNARWALFLDVDGTLTEIAPRPDQVVVSPAILAALRTLMQTTGGAVAIISGRPVEQIDALFAPLVLPAAGLHGLARRESADSGIERADAAAWHGEIAGRVARFVEAHPGVWAEDKGVTIAVHYRGAAEHEAAVRALADEIGAEGRDDLSVQPGKMILEFRPAGSHKGDVIERFLTHAPFAGRVPVFLGDDLTDEDGFRAVKAHGGHAVRVGHDAGAATEAEWTLASVAAAERWITAVADAMRDGSTMETA